MKNNNTYILISIGILFGALFPIGIYTLIFKILERILFSSTLNTFFASGIAAYSATIFAVFCFSRIMKYLMRFDYSKTSEIKKVFWLGVLATIVMHLTWIVIPFADGLFGAEYMAHLNHSYEILNSDILFSQLLINMGSELLSFLSIAYLIYRKISSNSE